MTWRGRVSSSRGLVAGSIQQKRKHVQIHQLQQQVQDMQDTLQGLLQGPDQPAGFPGGSGQGS